MKLYNQEIWLAYSKFMELSKIKFPVKTSLEIARLLAKLQQPYAIIEHERAKLVNHYGVKSLDTKTVSIDPSSLEAGDFARDFGELLTLEWADDIPFERVKLPEKTVDKCPSCKQDLEVTFRIDAQILLPLEKFVEI